MDSIIQHKAKKIQQCNSCHGIELQLNEDGFNCCINCGYIDQQIKFDSNVVFGEQKDLQGKNIHKLGFNMLSSQRRLKKAGMKIEDLVQKLAIPSDYQRSYLYPLHSIQAAHRLLRYADNCNFFKKGKKIDLYAAAALYITLRFNKAPYLLIDFSDKLGIKMFPLARCYLKMSKKFGFQQELPQIDPSLLIHRYCRVMNFGEKTQVVASSAIKLIKRMKRDWMCQGRRPSSLCGAAILISAAIHKIKNQCCSTTKICQTVFVCDETIRRRLDQFKHTKFSKIKQQDFKLIHSQQCVLGGQGQMDPPAFRKARLKSEQLQEVERQVPAISIKNRRKKFDDEFNQEENVPEEVIQKYSDEIARIYEKASEVNEQRVQEDIDEESQFSSEESNNTGGQRQEHENDDENDNDEDNSDVDEKLIFLDEKMQEERKRIWEEYHRAWLDKQASKVQRGEIEKKKKMKESIKKDEEECKNSSNTPFDALIKNSGFNLKINQEELKRLLTSEPKLEEEQMPKVSLTRIFDPFRWNKI